MNIKQGDSVRVVNVSDSVDLGHMVGKEGYVTDTYLETDTPAGLAGFYVRFGGLRDDGMMFYGHELEIVGEAGKPERLAFPSWESAVEYGKSWGGWLFLPKYGGPVEWFNPLKYTLTRIMQETEGPGFIGTWDQVERMCE